MCFINLAIIIQLTTSSPPPKYKYKLSSLFNFSILEFDIYIFNLDNNIKIKLQSNNYQNPKNSKWLELDSIIKIYNNLIVCMI